MEFLKLYYWMYLLGLFNFPFFSLSLRFPQVHLSGYDNVFIHGTLKIMLLDVSIKLGLHLHYIYHFQFSSG